MYSYVASAVAAAVPTPAMVSWTDPRPGLARLVTPYEPVVQRTWLLEAEASVTVQALPAMVTVT